jgi:outer membrane protein TolC
MEDSPSRDPMNARFAAVAALLLAGPSLGEEGPPLKDWISAALKNNPSRGVSQAAVLTAESERLRTGAALLPTVKAQAGYTRNQFDSVVEFQTGPASPPVQVVISPYNSLEALLVVRAPLIDPPGFARWRAARQGALAAAEDDRANANDVALLVARDYYATVATNQVLVAAQRAMSAAEENARIARVRLKEGAATPLITDRAELEVTRTEQQVVDANRTWEAARRALSSATGLAEPEALSAPSPRTDPAPPEAQLLDVAESNRPELKGARERETEADLSRKAAWAAFAPSLSAVGTGRWTNAAGFVGHAGYWFAGITAEWLLLDFGTRSAELKRTRASQIRTSAELTQRLLAVRDEVHSAWLDVEAARSKLASAQRGETVALRAAKESRARFMVGTVQQLDTIQSDRDALQATVDRIRAEGELSVARLALKRATGESLLDGSP